MNWAPPLRSGWKIQTASCASKPRAHCLTDGYANKRNLYTDTQTRRRRQQPLNTLFKMTGRNLCARGGCSCDRSRCPSAAPKAILFGSSTQRATPTIMMVLLVIAMGRCSVVLSDNYFMGVIPWCPELLLWSLLFGAAALHTVLCIMHYGS